MTRISGTLHEDGYTCMIISRSFLLRMRNISDKFVEKIKTHILCATTLPPPPSPPKNQWRNTIEPYRPQMTVQHVHIACWIHKTTSIHLEYVILIAFPLQQWLHEHASVLCYTQITRLAFWE
jgi:hypothetical protein